MAGRRRGRSGAAPSGGGTISGTSGNGGMDCAKEDAGAACGALRQIRLRLASPGDAGAILDIYRPYVDGTAVTFECRAPEPEEMAERIAKTLAGYPWIAAGHPGTGELLGYACAGPYYGREAYRFCCETSIYLRRGLARQGLGTRLYDALESVLRLQGLLSLCACIAVAKGPDPYLPGASVPFHESRGFRQFGHFPQCGYKFGRWYGVVWMEKPLGPRPAHPEVLHPFPAVRRDAERLLAGLSKSPL